MPLSNRGLNLRHAWSLGERKGGRYLVKYSVLRWRLKSESEEAVLIERGILFQIVGEAELKARSPIVL